MFQRLLASCLLALQPPLVAAQDLSPALQACRAEPDDARRLACYDRQVDAQLPPPAESAPVATPPPASTADAEGRFGMEDDLARSERVQAQEQGRELDELHSTIAQLARRPDGTLIITLENGQVWVPREFDPNFTLHVGDPARIRRGALGSYSLYGKSSRSTRVRRIR